MLSRHSSESSLRKEKVSVRAEKSLGSSDSNIAEARKTFVNLKKNLDLRSSAISTSLHSIHSALLDKPDNLATVRIPRKKFIAGVILKGFLEQETMSLETVTNVAQQIRSLWPISEDMRATCVDLLAKIALVVDSILDDKTDPVQRKCCEALLEVALNGSYLREDVPKHQLALFDSTLNKLNSCTF